MPTTYLHELSLEEYDLILRKEVSVNELGEKYLQPEWCCYPHALSVYGCWNLIALNVRKIEDCKDCEFCKHGQ